MDRTFSPCALSGVAAVPPSKSEAHRRMICAALTPGETRLTGFLPSRDMTATMDCLSALGASFRLEGETLLVRGCGGPAAFAPRMDCGESGSTLRFLIPLALALGEGGGFLMGGRLGERPLEPYDPILEACGVTSRRESTPQGVLLTLRGRLRPGNYTLPGDVSSQFVTGMLYALPQVRRFLNLQVASLLLVAAAMAQFTSYAANEVCYMLVFPYFVFSLGLCEKPLFKGFGRKTELSYGIYLYGFFVQQCLVWLCSRLGWTLPYWGLQVVSIALTMACAYLSAKLIEEPCMRLSKRLLARIPARGERATTH